MNCFRSPFFPTDRQPMTTTTTSRSSLYERKKNMQNSHEIVNSRHSQFALWHGKEIVWWNVMRIHLKKIMYEWEKFFLSFLLWWLSFLVFEWTRKRSSRWELKAYQILQRQSHTTQSIGIDWSLNSNVHV